MPHSLRPAATGRGVANGTGCRRRPASRCCRRRRPRLCASAPRCRRPATCREGWQRAAPPRRADRTSRSGSRARRCRVRSNGRTHSFARSRPAIPPPTCRCRCRKEAPVQQDAIRGPLVRHETRPSIASVSCTRTPPKPAVAGGLAASGRVDAARCLRIQIGSESFPIRLTPECATTNRTRRRRTPVRGPASGLFSAGKSPGEKREALSCIQPRECSQFTPARYDPSRSRDVVPVRRYETTLPSATNCSDGVTSSLRAAAHLIAGVNRVAEFVERRCADARALRAELEPPEARG